MKRLVVIRLRASSVWRPAGLLRIQQAGFDTIPDLVPHSAEEGRPFVLAPHGIGRVTEASLQMVTDRYGDVEV